MGSIMPEEDLETLILDREEEEEVQQWWDSDDLLGEELVQTLQDEVTNNPSDYNAHLAYISSLRTLDYTHHIQLRQAREAMSELFPLSPTMWRQWAKDEARLSSGNEGFDAIINIYERAMPDYLSVPLWYDYIDFVQRNDPLLGDNSSVGISKMRGLFERVVSAVGLHVTQGGRVWDAYVKFEQNVLHAIDNGRTDEKETQVQRIRSIFHRQLSVPLHDSESTLLAYKSWEVEQSNDFDEIPSHVSTAYENAVAMYNSRAHYEKQILKQGAPEEKLQHFIAYLKFEKSFGDPARVQILYERAVTEFPVSSELWLDYIHYLDETLKVGESLLDVHSRATRNCFWIGELWVRYLLSLEREDSCEEKLSNVFEKSLQCVFSSPEEYLNVFLTRINGLRRKMCKAASSDDSLDYSVIRSTFQRATDYLSPYLKNTNGLLRLHAYWAHLELIYGKDLAVMRRVWESLLESSDSMLEAWNQYIAMEIQMGYIEEARQIYERCYSKEFAGTGLEYICHSWLRFEKDFGTLEDYDRAAKKVTPRLEELQLFRLEQESKNNAASIAQKDDLVSKKLSRNEKMDARSTEEQPPAKRQRITAQDPTELLGKEATRTREEINVESGDPNVDKPDSINEKRIIHSALREIYTDQCTVFLSNLNFQVKEETLREFFSDVGGVTVIRVLSDKFTGKSRGLAYVDFKDDVHLAAALKKNKQVLMGKKVSILRSDPKNRRKEWLGKNAGERYKRGSSEDSSGSGEGFVSEHEGAETSHTSSSISKGKDTFAVHRAVVKPLGSGKIEQMEKDNQDAPKSNDEFRKLLLEKQGS